MIEYLWLDVGTLFAANSVEFFAYLSLTFYRWHLEFLVTMLSRIYSEIVLVTKSHFLPE